MDCPLFCMGGVGGGVFKKLLGGSVDLGDQTGVSFLVLFYAVDDGDEDGDEDGEDEEDACGFEGVVGVGSGEGCAGFLFDVACFFDELFAALLFFCEFLLKFWDVDGLLVEWGGLSWEAGFCELVVEDADFLVGLFDLFGDADDVVCDECGVGVALVEG